MTMLWLPVWLVKYSGSVDLDIYGVILHFLYCFFFLKLSPLKQQLYFQSCMTSDHTKVPFSHQATTLQLLTSALNFVYPALYLSLLRYVVLPSKVTQSPLQSISFLQLSHRTSLGGLIHLRLTQISD